MIKSNEKIWILTTQITWAWEKDTDVTLVKEESIEINETIQNKSHCTDKISNDGNKDTDVTLVKEEPN